MIFFRNKQSAIGLAMAVFAAAPSVHAAGVSGQGTWETTLQGRDLDGNVGNGFEAYYDTVQDITWLADANQAQTSGYPQSFQPSGRMGWAAATTWASNLNVHGVTGWRLPSITETGAPGCDRAYSGTDCGWNVSTSGAEMAHLFYVTLGNQSAFSTAGMAQPGGGLSNTGPFKNVQVGGYLYGTRYANPNYAWNFYTSTGQQSYGLTANSLHAWAVRDGDVAAVPEPGGIALTLVGLGIAGVAARRRRA